MKEAIISLIKEDIKHTGFIEHLNNGGLTADNYHLSLSTIIFDLMQLDRSNVAESDALNEGYLKLIRDSFGVINQNDELISRARAIYFFLNELHDYQFNQRTL